MQAADLQHSSSMPRAKKRKFSEDSNGILRRDNPQPKKAKKSKAWKKKLKKVTKKKQKMSKSSSLRSSSLSSSHSTKVSVNESDMGSVKATGVAKKSQCDMCKLSYSTEKELLEHLVSLMHHTKMEDREETPEHRCNLCSITCTDMADYRLHIGTDKHQKKLSNLRGDSNESARPDREKKNRTYFRHSDNPNFNNQMPPWGPGAQGQRTSHFPGKPKNKFFGRSDKRGPNKWNPSYNQNYSDGRYSQSDRNRYENGDTYGHRMEQNDKRWGQKRFFGNGNDTRSGFYEPWGSGVYGNHYQGEDFAHQHQTHFQTFGYHENNLNGRSMEGGYNENQYRGMDFTSDDSHVHWDEQSLVQREQFLAGMDDNFQYNQPPHYWSQCENSFDERRKTRWDDSHPRDRKRPRNGDDVQESLAKTSRSISQSSDENVPVRDVQMQQVYASTSNSLAKSKPPDSSSANSMNDTSDNLLERAERLCKELRQKREAAQVQRNRMLKQQDREFLNQKMNALVQKQQSYLKGHIRNMENAQEGENYDSGISSASTQLSKSLDPVAGSVSNKSSSGLTPSIKSKSSDKSLDEIRKAIEKSVLDGSEKSHPKQKITALPRSKQRSLSGGDAGLSRHGDGKDNHLSSAGRLASRPVSKPGLSKDSLMKMVNAPRSRDERLQLAKMVQSREEHRTAPRANIQLEGLYDSTIDIGGENQDVDPPTIKLEDLSEGVRDQILALIGEDMSSQAFGQSELEPQERLPPGHQPKTRTSGSKDIIVLSENEQESTKSKVKKAAAQRSMKDGSSSRMDKNSEVSSKVKRKKKKSIDDSNTKSISLNKNSDGVSPVKPKHINDGGNLRSTTPVKHLNDVQTLKPEKKRYSIDMATYSDVEVVSCSSDVDQGEKKHSNGHQVRAVKERTRSKSPVVSQGELHPEPDTNTPIPITEQRSLPRNGIASTSSTIDQGQAQLNRENVKEMFPTLMNAPRGNKVSAITGKSSFVSNNAVLSMRLANSSSQLATSAAQLQNSTTDRLTSASSQESEPVNPSPSPLDSYPTRHLTLPPSAHLRHNSSSPDGKQMTPNVSSASPVIISTFSLSTRRKPEGPDMTETSTETRFSATDNVLNSKGERIDLTEDTPSTASITTKGNETSSRAMSELAVLSDREREVKQELVSMELRMSRLHQLLEQAVVQINKCSARRHQLHIEEQELSKKKLSLLRDAASSTFSTRSDVSDANSVGPHSSPASQKCVSAITSGSKFASTTSLTTNLPSSIDFQNSSNTGESSVLPAVHSLRTSSIEQSRGTSLSKADWLAKFASYLPPDTVRERNNIEGSKSDLHSAESDKTQQSCPSSMDQPIRLPPRDPASEKNSKNNGKDMDVEITDSQSSKYPFSKLNCSTTLEKPAATNSLSTFTSTGDITRQSVFQETAATTIRRNSLSATSTASVTTSVTTSIIGTPIMYVGCFRSPTAPVKESSLDAQLNQTALSSLFSKPVSSLSNNISDLQRSLSSDARTKETQNDNFGDRAHEFNFEASDSVALPKPMRLYNNNNHHTGEDSDIGSIASSVASGSSLGEQISHYCKSTPGASLDTAQTKHELSTIMSDTSELRGIDSQLEEEEDDVGSVYVKKEDWDSVVRPCSVPLEKIDYLPGKGIYGNLNKEAVKSAEALHLMERNYDATSFASSLNSEGGKKKKRKSKQARNVSRLTHHRRHWVMSSSSEEEKEQEGKKNELNISEVTSRAKRSGIFSSNNEDSSACEGPKLGRLTPKPDVLKTEFQSPNKADVTIAECDSSTNLGIVDSESLTQRTNTLKEMRASFERTFGRSPDFTSSETAVDINSTTDVLLSDKQKEDTVYQSQLNQENFKRHSTLDDEIKGMREKEDNVFGTGKQSAENFIDISDLTTTFNNKGRPRSGSLSNVSPTTLVSKPFFSSRSQVSKENVVEDDKKRSRFPGDLGPVYDIQVVKEQLYIGHRNSCVCVYNLHESYQESPVCKYPFPSLQCMTVVTLKDVLTIVVGSGETLIFFDPNQTDCVSFEMGTKIKCVLLVSPVVYIGLQSGEVHSVDIVKMKEKDRFLCSDYPIHCLAPAQEGSMKLLCASVEDGTIIVLNAQQCLPIRILTGHTKTAFSLQVEGQFLYSGSGDSTVQIQNVHTATVEHVFKDNKGVVMSVYWYKGYLFTGGMDKLVRCYNTKINELVQVFYGAERGVITKILVHNNRLITANLQGSVDVLELQLDAQHKCHKKGCGLNFGNRSHLFWHLLEDHNITAVS